MVTVTSPQLEEARTKMRKAEEESAWREYERTRRVAAMRAQQDANRAVRTAQFVATI